MSLSPGTRLGPYEIQAAIGAGGMGEVYRARDSRIGRDVAVKVLGAAFASDTERLRRFHDEARAVGALNHPNILALFDVGQQDGVEYLVTELLDGASLRDRLESGPLPLRRAIDIARQVASGLAAAHDAHVVHRDLKPENIFVTRDERAKILDFGLAKQAGPPGSASDATRSLAAYNTTPGVILGTVGYMSPEQVTGKPADARSDIFAFGAVLHEMLSGQRAFRRETPAETLAAILREEPPDPPSTAVRPLPATLARIARRCLEKDPDRRFQSTRDLVFALENVSDVSAPAVAGAPASAAASLLRHRALWAVALVGAIGLAAFLLRGIGQRPLATHQQVTYRRGSILGARFAGDARGVVFAAQWGDEPLQVQTTEIGQTDSRPLGVPSASLAAVSPQSELALLVRCRPQMFNVCDGTLARVPLAGGAPREILEHVRDADWTPDGSALAVVVREPDATRLEYPPGHLLYRTTGWLSAPRFSPDGRTIAVAVHPVPDVDVGYVALVGLDGAVKRLTDDYVSLEGLAWNRNTGEIWFAGGVQSGWANTFFGVSPSGAVRKIVQYPAAVRLFDIAPDGRVLFTTEDWASRVTGYFPGDAAEHEYSWLDGTLVSDISEDGKWLLFWEAGAATSTGMVYLRKTDGSPAVPLGEGMALSLSPDGKWALSSSSMEGTDLRLLPTGPGEPVSLPKRDVIVRSASTAWWSKDSSRFAFAGIAPNHKVRVYLGSRAPDAPVPVTPDLQTPLFAIASDGRIAAVPAAGDRIHFFASDGSDLGVARGAEPGEVPVRFAEDGQLVVRTVTQLPMPVYELDPRTGRRRLWKNLGQTRRDGFDQQEASWFVLTPNLKYYAYTHGELLSALYVAQDLR